MPRWSPRAGLAVLALAALFVIPVAALASGAPGPALRAPPSAVLSGTGATLGAPSTALALHPGESTLLSRVHAAMAANHIPSDAVYLPNFGARVGTSSGHVSPLYVSAPAPMGLGDFGVVRSGSHDVGRISYTSSVRAQVTINSADPFYLASTSPDLFGMQLNTVAVNVDVLGNTSYDYWTQNVPTYSPLQQTLQFVDNIWNFSSPTSAMQVGTLANYTGTLVPNNFYYKVTAPMHLAMPFTINLYNNLTLTNHLPTLWYNYSLTSTSGTTSGSYDEIQFNSAPSPHHAAPHPTFQIDGVAPNPLGLLNDAEIMIGGPGGGSTTTMNAINAAMGLWLKSNATGRYSAVPAGYDYGTDTGETSEGIAEYTNGGASPMAELRGGPSILYGLWGLTGTTSGYVSAKFTLTPSNAFIFASSGRSLNTAAAGWAPSPASGTADFRLAAGHSYTFRFLLSDYKPRTVTVTRSTTSTITLATDASLGVYTPLWAWNNAQLAAISQAGGAGTKAHPYVLANHGVTTLDPLFGEFNDYLFQVFPGLLIADTTAYVTATNLYDFPIDYTLSPESAAVSGLGLPVSNNLGLEVYNASHVSIWQNSQITGWWGAVNGFGNSYASEVLLWNATNDLVGGNHFQVQGGTGISMAGGGANTLWGNTFTTASTTATNPAANIVNPSFQTGALLYENGDLVFNNYFGTVYTAYTPGFNLYTGAGSLWTDSWNISKLPATASRHVNGMNLTGSIVGNPSVSGNFWDDYGMPANPYGQLPYNEYGAISVGGDYSPVLPYALYRIHFLAHNLTAGSANWTVTINGYSQTTSGLSLVFWEPAGTYAYTASVTSPYLVHPSQGAVTLSAGPVWKTLKFS